MKNIPVMVTNSKTGTSEKTKETFVDSIKPRIENNINVNMLNSLEVAQGIVKTYEGQVKTTKKEETLKNIADEFFENQRKSGVFPGSAINSQNNGAFASSVGNLNSVNKAIEVDSERIVKAKENTKILQDSTDRRKQEEIKKREEQRTFLDEIGATVGTVVLSAGEGVATTIQDIGKTGALIFNGVVTAYDWAGSRIGSIWNENSTSNFDKRNELRWLNVEKTLAKNYTEEGFDRIYDNTNFGQNLKFDSYSFDTVRDVVKGIGYILASLAIGGAVGKAVGAVGSSTGAIASTTSNATTSAKS